MLCAGNALLERSTMNNSPLLQSGQHLQRGAAALTITLLLFGVLALALAFVNRQLIFEQRSSHNQVRAAMAQEAAQAGLDWAQALINSPWRLDSACQAVLPSGASSSAKTWRDLQRRYAPGPHLQHSQIGLTAACLRAKDGWRCHCPSSGSAHVALPLEDTPVPGFVVRVLDHALPGHLRLHAKGCSQAGPDCWDLGSTTPAGYAQTHLQAQLALAGGLRTAPAAALTALGEVHGAALGAHHNEAGSSGVAVHAGGKIHLVGATLNSVAGGTRSAGLLADDADLAATSPEQLFTALWGMGMARWAAQSSVQSLSCTSDCGLALQAAIAERSNRMVYVPGDITLEASAGGPLVLGSADEPLLLVVKGKLTVLGAVQLHGALYANELHWNRASADAFLRGAAWSQTQVHSDSAPQFYFDSAVLDRLRWNTGSFALLHGSWKDAAP
jgi:hypothetical protein